MWPCYLGLLSSGELAARAGALRELLRPCRLCPRECGVDRLAGEPGFCRSGSAATVASFGAHFGEEAPLVGCRGSGTIFLSGCNLGCVFCQNYHISHRAAGTQLSPERLAMLTLELQARGCHNPNFVTPTHFAPQIVEGIALAAEKGLRLPIVWNCGGYESLEAIRLLDGIVDIYMPDAKYAESEASGRLSAAPDYPQRMMAALGEMHRQVGDLELDANRIARRGLLVRHLVLPGGLAGTDRVMQFLAGLSRDTYVNLMAQYRPCFRAREHAEIARPITGAEYAAAVQAAFNAGLYRLDERPQAPLA